MKINRNNRTKIEELLVDESIFAMQNGLIGVKGNFAEGYGDRDYKQTLINGFFNYYPYHYEENSPVFPQIGQRIINVIDGQTIEFYIDDLPINKTTCNLISLSREFDLKKGLTTRKAIYKTNDNKVFTIEEERLVSLVQLELLAIKIKISTQNHNGKIKVLSKLTLPSKFTKKIEDSRINVPDEIQINISDKSIDDEGVYLKAKTTSSNLCLGVGLSHSDKFTYYYNNEGFIGLKYINLSKDNPYEFIKYVVYTPSTIHKNVIETTHNILKTINNKGYDYYTKLQKQYIDDFWKKTHLKILENEEKNMMLQYNLYQLYTSTNNKYNLNIPAKGLTGEGYEGHYFWDTEIYMIPFFTITNPSLAKNLLLYRYFHLNQAKQEAKKLGVNYGAKIPWRTIDGFEASPYYLAGSAQYHINSDVAYSIIKYYEYTNDLDFMINYGFELLIETARFLYHSGNFSNESFHILGITGPDEYTALVNDNYYTNTMAKYHFNYIYEFYNENKEKLYKYIDKSGLNEKEIHDFKEAANKMYIKFDETLEIFAQDDSFLQKPELDLNIIPKENFPLLLHYHPMFIYKHQILKQADVLLALVLLDYNNLEILENNFNYYLKRTTHDSSLSKCIHSLVAFRLGKSKLGYSYLNDILKMDLENSNKNTDHGLHIANSGGIYLTLIYGIIGLRIHKNNLWIRPTLPKKLKGIETSITYQETKIFITLKEKIEIKVSKPINLGIYNDIILINEIYHCDYKF